MTHLLSLAAGTVPELAPVETVRVAAEAGWPATGLWYDADTWSTAATGEVRRALDDTGLVALDLEPVFITASGDHGDALVDTAAEVGARHVLVVGIGADDVTMVDRLAALGARAASVGVTCALEFGPLFTTPDLATAVDTVARAGDAGLAVLVDALHLARSGGSPTELADLDPRCSPTPSSVTPPPNPDTISAPMRSTTASCSATASSPSTSWSPHSRPMRRSRSNSALPRCGPRSARSTEPSTS